MHILGIETSCDETAASVVTDGVKVRSSVIASSLADHVSYGGVVPELASRRQLEFIDGVVARGLKEAKLRLHDMDAVAVTKRPGLIGSLLVGLMFARTLAFALKKPLVEIDHIKAHLYANYLQFSSKKSKAPAISRLPAVGLVVSGGHSSLYYIKDFKNFKLIGSTRDDAAGEAFDKVAKILDLGYPGGPVIDRLSRQGRNDEIKFPVGLTAGYDFSFSGLKTAVLYYTQKHKTDPFFSRPKVAYAFQESVVAVLVQKALKAAHRMKVKTLIVGGGVAANSALRHVLRIQSQLQGLDVFFPSIELCQDNAAMIAGLGFHQLN